MSDGNILKSDYKYLRSIMMKIMYIWWGRGGGIFANAWGNLPFWWYPIQILIVQNFLHPQQLELTCVPLIGHYHGIKK